MLKVKSYFGLFGLPRFRRKDRDPSFLSWIVPSRKKVSLDLLIEDFKPVVVNEYEFKNLDKNFENIFGIFDLPWFGSKKKHRHKGSVLGW